MNSIYHLSDDVKQKSRRIGLFILDSALALIGVCVLFLVSVAISIGMFLFNIFMWFIAIASFGWILCFIGAWACHAYLEH